MVALMVGTHCWNATLQQEVATVLAPVRKGPARPPAPATPAARDVGTGPQPSHSASPAGAHTVSPAPRATTARQREFTPPARLHSLAVSPPRAMPASAPLPPKPPSSPPSSPRAKTASLLFPASPSEATPPPAPPPAQSPPRRRSEVHASLTRRVTVSAQQRRSKARMGDRGCRVGIWWPRGEPTWNPAEAHQQRWSQTTTSCLRVTKDSSGVGLPSASLSTSGTSVGSMCEPDRKSRQAGQPIERR